MYVAYHAAVLWGWRSAARAGLLMAAHASKDCVGVLLTSTHLYVTPSWRFGNCVAPCIKTRLLVSCPGLCCCRPWHASTVEGCTSIKEQLHHPLLLHFAAGHPWASHAAQQTANVATTHANRDATQLDIASTLHLQKMKHGVRTVRCIGCARCWTRSTQPCCCFFCCLCRSCCCRCCCWWLSVGWAGAKLVILCQKHTSVVQDEAISKAYNTFKCCCFHLPNLPTEHMMCRPRMKWTPAPG